VRTVSAIVALDTDDTGGTAMTTMTTAHDDRLASATGAHPMLRPMIEGAAVFDSALGVVSLVFADRFADWLSISTASVRITGAVFLVAAVTGAITVLRRRLDVRWIIEANLLFAAWCLAVVGFDAPNGLGIALLVVSAAAAAATALAERRLS
jgi:drug/metabolite transporter (DMT)-like permease